MIIHVEHIFQMGTIKVSEITVLFCSLLRVIRSIARQDTQAKHVCYGTFEGWGGVEQYSKKNSCALKTDEKEIAQGETWEKIRVPVFLTLKKKLHKLLPPPPPMHNPKVREKVSCPPPPTPQNNNGPSLKMASA